MEEIISYIQSCPVTTFTKGETLLFQGQTDTRLYAIKSGFVKVHDIAKDGSDQLLSLEGKYDFIPIEVLFNDETDVRYFYSAFTDVEVYGVDKTKIHSLIGDNPAVLQRIVTTLSSKHGTLVRHLNAAQKPRARERLIYALELLATSFSDSSNEAIVTIGVPLTHQDIASLVNLTRETTSIELKKLKDEGFVTYDKISYTVYLERLRNELI